MADQESAVRSYLRALKDPASLRDDDAIDEVRKALEAEEDMVARVQLQQQLLDLESPSMESAEDAFVTHAKAWADEVGITAKAFAAEGVPTALLRRAGFAVGRGSSRGSGRRRSSSSGKRVTTEEVIAAIPRGAFTVKDLREKSGASAAVVRNAIKAQVDEGALVEVGPDPDHSGPGRAATLYKKG